VDRIIFGDNQFFGINHMSEEKAAIQAERFRDVGAIIRTLDIARDCGINALMLNTHTKVAEICDHFRKHSASYGDLRLYPSFPYAHKYADLVNEMGIVGAIREAVFSGQSTLQAFGTIARGGLGVFTRDMVTVMKLLVDAELRMFRELNVQAFFLQNIVTDLLLGMHATDVFVEFANYIKEKYKVCPAFNTMNMPRLVDLLLECGVHDPIVCSSINPIGYMMSPDKASYEEAIRSKPFRPLAMSIMASGAVAPKEAIDYVVGLGKVQSIVFGASSPGHIAETKRLIDEAFDRREQEAA